MNFPSFQQFHAYCALKWFAFAEKAVCPVCKTTHKNDEVHLWPRRIVEEDKEADELPAAAAHQEQRQPPPPASSVQQRTVARPIRGLFLGLIDLTTGAGTPPSPPPTSISVHLRSASAPSHPPALLIARRTIGRRGQHNRAVHCTIPSALTNSAPKNTRNNRRPTVLELDIKWASNIARRARTIVYQEGDCKNEFR